MTEDYRKIVDLVLRNQVTHEESGSLTAVDLCFDMEALEVASMVAAQRLADNEGEVVLYNFDPEMFGSEGEYLTTALAAVGYETLDEVKGDDRLTVVDDFEPFFEQSLRRLHNVTTVLMVDPFHHSRGTDETADEQMIIRCKDVVESMQNHVVLICTSKHDVSSVEDLTCWTGNNASMWQDTLAKDLHEAACLMLEQGRSRFGWSLMEESAVLGYPDACREYGRAAAGKVSSDGAVELNPRKALAILSSIDSKGGSVSDIIDDAIQQIELAQEEVAS